MMESYLELKKRHQKEVNEFPFGFAFSPAQFVEMMRKWGLDYEKDINKIVSMGMEDMCRKKIGIICTRCFPDIERNQRFYFCR